MGHILAPWSHRGIYSLASCCSLFLPPQNTLLPQRSLLCSESAAGVKLQEAEDLFPLIKSVCVVETHFLDHKTNH